MHIFSPQRRSGQRLHSLTVWIPWLVLIFLAAAALLNALQTTWGIGFVWAQPFLDSINIFSSVFLGIFIEAVPYLLLGTLASGLVEEFVRSEDLAHLIPANSHLAPILGSLLGLCFPVCECGTVPLTRRLIHKGLPVSVGIAFLLAAPVINPIVIASTLAAFGPTPVFWLRIGLTFLVASVIGLIFSFEPDPAKLLRTQPGEADLHVHAMPVILDPELVSQKKEKISMRLKRVMTVTADEFVEMGRYLVIGAALAAVMQTFIAQGTLLALGKGPVLSVIVMALLAALLSICSTVDAFIALAFAGSFSTGAIATFLVFGPMVDIKAVLMFAQVFKRKTVLLLVVLPFLMSVIAGIVVNFLE